MRKLFFGLLLLFGTGLPGPVAGQATGQEKVTICDDEAEWPPYAYFARTADGIDRSRIEGATVELVAEIFSRIGLPYSYDMIPWNRCLHEVANFDSLNRYEMVANASYNEERAANYYATAPIYMTRFGIGYNREQFPKGRQSII